MKSDVMFCVILTIVLLTGCAANQPIPDFRGLPEEFSPIYDQSLADLGEAALGKNHCVLDCETDFETDTVKRKICIDYCECLHRDQELKPTWNRAIACINEILDRVQAD